MFRGLKRKISLFLLRMKEYYNIGMTVFFRFVCFFYRKFHRELSDEMFIGFSSAWYGGNVKALLDAIVERKEIVKKRGIKLYFVSPNKEQVKIARSKGVEAFWWHDPAGIPVFSKTGLFVTSHGESYLPVTRRKFFKDFLKDVIGEFGDRLSLKRNDLVGGGFVVKRLELWHGIPFKDVYIDKIPIPPDVFCVTSNFMKEWYSAKGYDSSIFRVTGYPRNDIFFRDINRDKILLELDIPLEKKIILYAPTWGHFTGKELFPWGNLRKTLFLLNDFTERNNVFLIIRVHKYWEGGDYREIEKILSRCSSIKWVSMEMFPDTYSLLAVTDVLITDWSSIAFDFMLLRKPIIFIDCFNPYGKFCFTADERAGAIVKNEKQLIIVLKESLKDPVCFIEKYAPDFDKILDKAFLYKDGKASERVIKELEKLLER